VVTIKSTNEIVLNLIDYFKSSQPLLDTKPGTVARDLFIDAPSSQIALLYDELSKISNLQSLRLVAGSDLDKLAQNFGATRNAATKSSGVALLTFASLPAVVSVASGSIITASNGSTFTVQNGISVNPSSANTYKSTAVQYQNNLSFLGITDPYAVEVTVQASTTGSAGNLSQYALNTTTIAGVSNVTNVYPFTGGADQESDPAFRNRVLAIFSGSNIGTALGYRNLALTNPSVSDAVVIGPGNPLMVRDGTVVVKNPNGTYTIISEGTGGKVDIYILGTSVTEYTDTFIYLDKSNDNDPTNALNNYVLGQIVADANLTVTQKRLTDIANGVLPAQPVQEILAVTGSLSGANFIPATTNSLGQISGNYELIKDTGNYAGSPWGFDTFHWTSNNIVYNEDIVKSTFNGQDPTTFADVIHISDCQQNVSISSENSQVLTGNNSTIQLLHTPATNVTRVFNVNTGESYTVTNQNLNGTGTVNTSGQISISGNTLPSTSDILQVDYTWIVSYDPYSDFDGKYLNNNPRANTDSIDWGYSNEVRNERVLFTLNSAGTLYNGTTSLPVTSVISANTFDFTAGTVVASTVVNFTNRLMVNIVAIDNQMNSIESLFLSDTFQEAYNTAEDNGFIINNSIVVGTLIKYNVIIVLPTDTTAVLGDLVSITYNQANTFSTLTATGSTSGNQVTIPAGNVSTIYDQVYLDVTYVAALQNLLTAGITNFPISRGGNGYLLNNSIGSINAIESNTIRRETQTLQTNSSNQLYVSLSITTADYSLTASQIIAVIDMTSNENIWDGYGTVTASTTPIASGPLQGDFPFVLTFSGVNAPAAGDNVLVIYFATDSNRYQPFTYSNPIYKIDYQNLLYNYTTNNFYVPLQNFVLPETNVTFNIIDNTTGLIIATGMDGYISSVSSNGSVATFNSQFFNTELTGTATFTNGSLIVNGVGTLFTEEIQIGQYVKLSTDSNTVFAQVNSIISNTQLQLGQNSNMNAYAGSTGSGIIVLQGVDDFTGKTIQLVTTENVNNLGSFNIISVASANTINIGLPLANLAVNQISVIRIKDDNELWSTEGTIDAVNNVLNLPQNILALQNDKVVVIIFGNQPLHQSPTRLSITVADQVQNTGVVTASGTTVTQVASVVFTAINGGLRQNALAAFKTFLGLTSNSTIASNNYIVRVVSLEKVTVTTGNQILSTVATYDVLGTSVQSNSLYPNEMIEDVSLQNTEFILPATTNNISNAPSIGDSLLITFYYATDGNSENVYFTKNGTLYTNNKFAFLDELYISSGFNSSLSARFTVSFFTQPATGNRYTAYYNYLAPKQNERILIQYNYNQLISTVTFTVENQRPINADVLIKAALELEVDATLVVGIATNSTNSPAIVLQNVQSAITSTINTNTLGAVLYSSDLIAAAQAVSGVTYVQISYFNQDGIAGQVLSLTCQENQYFVANNIIVTQGS
jgi:hypothetical protein